MLDEQLKKKIEPMTLQFFSKMGFRLLYFENKSSCR